MADNFSAVNAESYASAVGDFLRTFRAQHGLTLDAVATAGREFGATWGAASIRNIEAGKLAPTIPNLMVLALALGKLTGRSMKLSDLLGEAEVLELPVQGSARQPVPRSWVDGVLNGRPVHLEVEPARRQTSHEQLLDPQPFGTPSHSHDTVSSSLAERRAAERLGIDAGELQEWADQLWGRSLEEEAGHRAGPKSTPQARGHVTRGLVEEIRGAIDDAKQQTEQDQEDLRDLAEQTLTDQWPI